MIFVEKTFVNCSLVLPIDAMSPNFTKKTFADSHKISKIAKVFSLASFPLFNTFKSYIEAIILDEFTQELYMTSRSYNCIHKAYQQRPVQLEIPTSSFLCHGSVGLSCYVKTTTEII